MRTSAIVLGVAGLLAVLGVWLLQTSPAAEASREAERRTAGGPEAKLSAAPAASLTVDALTVETREARAIVDVAGVLEPVRHVVIGAEVAGRVVAIDAEEHTWVAAGDVLVRLDPALTEAAAARSRAALLKAEAALELAESELGRRRDLAGKGVASQAELDRAESEARSGRAQVAEARAALTETETRLAKTRITAPFAGVVASQDLEPGAYVRPGDPVAELADLSEIEIEVGVSDRQILALKDGEAVLLEVQALPGRWFPGQVRRLGRTADPLTRKYPVPVRVPNDEAELLPGMLGTVRFELGDGHPSLRIPRRAIQREFDLDYLFVLDADAGDGIATARRRRVQTRPLAFHPDQLEVTSGLRAGERIAVTGVRELREGLRVRVRERAQVVRGDEPS